MLRKQIWQARQTFLRAIDKSQSCLDEDVKAKERTLREYEECRRNRMADEAYYKGRMDVVNATLKVAEARGDYYAIDQARWNVRHWQSRYDANMTDVKYWETEILRVTEQIATLKERSRLLVRWLRECGLHPFIENGQISYCPKGRKRHNYRQRQLTGMERFIARNAPENCQLSGPMLEKFCKCVMGFARRMVVRFLTGEEIREAYRYSVGGHSCMAGQDEYRQRVLLMYAENPDIVNLAVVCFADKKGAPLEEISHESTRCLVWKTPKGPFIDRTYYAGGMSNMRTFVQKELKDAVASRFPGQVMHREDASSCGPSREMEFVIKAASNGEIPYLDSMRLQNIGDGKYALRHMFD